MAQRRAAPIPEEDFAARLEDRSQECYLHAQRTARFYIEEPRGWRDREARGPALQPLPCRRRSVWPCTSRGWPQLPVSVMNACGQVRSAASSSSDPGPLEPVCTPSLAPSRLLLTFHTALLSSPDIFNQLASLH